MEDLMARIVIDQRVMVGKPIIKGTRITVDAILDSLASGMTIEEIAKDYVVKVEDVRAAIAYARKIVAGEEVIPLEA